MNKEIRNFIKFKFAYFFCNDLKYISNIHNGQSLIVCQNNSSNLSMRLNLITSVEEIKGNFFRNDILKKSCLT